jgi:hypothetical protein
VDAVHNQALLGYDVLPVALQLPLGPAKTSLLIPPLLALAYALLGGVLPAITSAVLQAPSPPPSGLAPAARASLAVASTICIIKVSEVLITSTALSPPAALFLLAAACIAQWRLLDASLPSLVLATIAAVGGPIAELPLMKLGCWHYLSPDYWPLAPFGIGPDVPGATWGGLSLITGPCYFAVTTDAIALGRWFASGDSGGASPEASQKTVRAAGRNSGRRARGMDPLIMCSPGAAPRARRPEMQLGREEQPEARVAVKPSAVSGLCAFAAEPIRCGCFVCQYQGERLTQAEAKKRYGGTDAEYLFRLNGDHLIDASQTNHFSSKINHAQHGTLRTAADECGISFYASRDLRVGDELTFDYGEEFWVAARHGPAPCTDGRDFTLRRLFSPYMLRRLLRTTGPLWGSLLLPLVLPAVACSLMI